MGSKPEAPSASWISTRALRLMSGKSGIKLTSGNELSSVTLTSRTFVLQIACGAEAGEFHSLGNGLLSSSYQSVPVEDSVDARVGDVADLGVVRPRVQSCLPLNFGVDVRCTRERP